MWLVAANSDTSTLHDTSSTFVYSFSVTCALLSRSSRLKSVLPSAITGKFDGRKVCSKSRDHTLPLRMCYGEVYGNIAHEENGSLIQGSQSLWESL